MGTAASFPLDHSSTHQFIQSPTSRTGSASDHNSSPHKSHDYPTFIVALSGWAERPIDLPDQFRLRISYESLDFIHCNDEQPIIQFPFQNIICWGSSRHHFQFKVFDFQNQDPQKKESGILISLKSSQGRQIEDATMSTVQKLMVDINHRAISKSEFQTLTNTLIDEEGLLVENWASIINQFTSTGRRLLAKQGMELLTKIGIISPFDKFDLACLLYEKIINHESFQLLVNTFDDPIERANLIHRLKLDSHEFVNTCIILPEK